MAIIGAAVLALVGAVAAYLLVSRQDLVHRSSVVTSSQSVTTTSRQSGGSNPQPPTPQTSNPFTSQTGPPPQLPIAEELRLKSIAAEAATLYVIGVFKASGRITTATYGIADCTVKALHNGLAALVCKGADTPYCDVLTKVGDSNTYDAGVNCPGLGPPPPPPTTTPTADIMHPTLYPIYRLADDSHMKEVGGGLMQPVPTSPNSAQGFLGSLKTLNGRALGFNEALYWTCTGDGQSQTVSLPGALSNSAYSRFDCTGATPCMHSLVRIALWTEPNNGWGLVQGRWSYTDDTTVICAASCSTSGGAPPSTQPSTQSTGSEAAAIGQDNGLTVYACPTTGPFPTSTFRPRLPDTTPPAAAATQRGMAVYANNAMFLLAPSGWECTGGEGQDGNDTITVYPQGQSSTSPTEAVSGTTIPSCAFCIWQQACAYFPAARKIFAGYGLCPQPPAAEQHVQTRATSMDFADSPGVAGSGFASGGANPANGVQIFVSRTRDQYAARETCTLPQSEHTLCTATLDDFINRYAASHP